MAGVGFDSVTQAREHIKDLLDAAVAGHHAGLRRERQSFAIVDAGRLRKSLATSARHAQVVAEADGWSVFIPGTPIAADGRSLQEAVTEMVDALREYAVDWTDHLSTAANHVSNWGLVQLVELSTDDELADWLRSEQLLTTE
ncbi:MAG: prevent-host-death protein [Actinomycetota bacterium]|nr:prevent-host-death protein [Actinomycetota bacterium]